MQSERGRVLRHIDKLIEEGPSYMDFATCIERDVWETALNTLRDLVERGAEPITPPATPQPGE